jgi:anti-sigma-K factor RskA
MTSRETMARKRDCGGDAAAYVLGALEREQAEAFRAHLDTCVECREEVSAFQDVVDALPLVASPKPVPRRLKRRVMAEVRAGSPQPKRLRDRVRLPSLLTTIPRPAMVASAIVLALAVAGGVVALTSSSGSAARVYVANVTGPGSAKLSVRGGRGELIVRGLPAPPSNDIYQVWLKRGRRAPAPTTALFGVTSNGAGTVAVPGSLRGGDQVLVTPEPRGGSPAPTHAPIIVARLS